MSESDVEFVREWKEIPEPKQLVKFTDAQRLRNVRIKRTTVKASDEQSDEPKISAEKDPLALGPVLYKCNICVSSCYDAHGIIAHMNVHPRAKRSPSARAYECDTCGKKFPHRRNILAHLRRMHSAERSITLKRYVSEGRPGERAYEHAYVCAHCEKTFERDANMKRHIRNVHDGRESRCDICSRVFSCSEYVKKHIYRTHRKVSA